MSARPPETVDPWRLAERGNVIAGEIELASLSRLVAVLLDSEGSVQFQLKFSQDQQNRVKIEGFVRAALALECQRCLEKVVLSVDARPELVVIEVPSEADRIPEECEPVLVEDGTLRIQELVEEELLLAIPLVPMHALEDCAMAKSDTAVTERHDDREESGPVSPFSILSRLKLNK